VTRWVFLLMATTFLTGCAKSSVIVLEPGSGDFGSRLMDAIHSCPPSVACWIDARQVTGAQTAASNIVIDRALTTIEVGFSSLTMAPGTQIEIRSNYVTVQGVSFAVSAVKCQSNPCVSIHDNYATVLRDIAFIPVSSAAVGIEIRNARGPGALLDRVSVEGFSEAALRVLDGSWTWTVEDSQFVRSGDGVEFLGDQANAWKFSRNLINSNTHAGVLMRLCDYPSSYGGCTTNGMVFSDENHFEGNEVGIRLVNGSIYNLDIRDSYAELTKSNTGFLIAANDGRPNTQLRIGGLLVSGGGGYVSGGVALNILDATKGYALPPVAAKEIECADGSCTVTTEARHGLTCSTLPGYLLCPYVHMVSADKSQDITTRITSILGPRRFTFFLNGARSATGGSVSYAPDLINAIIENQKWDSSWTAPPMIQSTGATVAGANNSVLDGLGHLEQF